MDEFSITKSVFQTLPPETQIQLMLALEPSAPIPTEILFPFSVSSQDEISIDHIGVLIARFSKKDSDVSEELLSHWLGCYLEFTHIEYNPDPWLDILNSMILDANDQKFFFLIEKLNKMGELDQIKGKYSWAGADAENEKRFSHSPLTFAVMNGRMDIAKRLKNDFSFFHLKAVGVPNVCGTTEMALLHSPEDFHEKITGILEMGGYHDLPRKPQKTGTDYPDILTGIRQLSPESMPKIADFFIKHPTHMDMEFETATRSFLEAEILKRKSERTDLTVRCREGL